MAFSSLSEVFFMVAMYLKRRSQSGNVSFGKRIKADGVISGEYGAWSLAFVEFLAKNNETLYSCNIFSNSA